MKKCGIYKITNIKTGQIYVGSSINIDYRLWRHFNHLSKNNHCNKILQNSFNKYGCKFFITEVVLLCDRIDLITMEQFYIDLFSPEFNILKIAGGNNGPKQSEETKEKLRLKRIEYFKTNSTWNKGKKFSMESRLKMSQAKKGCTPWNKGLPRTIDEKAKISTSNMGKRNPRSKRIVHKDLDGNILNYFDSMGEASRKLNISKSGIKACCNGIQNKTHDYKFEIA